MKLQIYKYRGSWSSGIGKWLFVNLTGYSKASVKDYFDRINSDWSFGEHYRGVNWKKVSKPSKEFLQEELERLEDKQESIRKRIRSVLEYIQENNVVFSDGDKKKK